MVDRDEIFLSVRELTLRDKVRSCEIRSALNIEPRLRIGKISTTVVRYRDQNAQGTIGSGSLVGYTHWKAAQRSSKN